MAQLIANVNITVTLTDGRTITVKKFGPPDMVAFERRFGVASAVMKTDPRLEYILFLTWSAARRSGLEGLDDFDAFVEAIEGFDRDEVTEGKAPAEAPPTT